MRVYFHLSPNREPVPFNYQQQLVGAFHRWLGNNDWHDELSLYSLSWLSHGTRRGNCLDFPTGSTFFVSAPNPELLSDLVQGVFAGQQICWGMEVQEVSIQRTPTFGAAFRFRVESPVLIKRKIEDKKQQEYYFPGDPESNALLTETFRHKLTRAGLPPMAEVRFDPDYQNPKVKMITYRNLDIKAAYCPVIVEGSPRAVQFAWEVGIGNSTGIGFGALR